MRTTLDIDADVLMAAKEIAGRTKRPAGKVLSDLARDALTASNEGSTDDTEIVNGFEVIPAAGRVVTSELVSAIGEEVDLS